jgi:signal transduction histidine kinase
MPEAEFQLLRIAREAVCNSVQHSDATKLEVELRATKTELLLSIQDNGKGFDARIQQRGHFGLLGMRERAREIGAHLEIQSEPGGGVRISIQLPLSQSPGKSSRTALAEHQLQ